MTDRKYYVNKANKPLMTLAVSSDGSTCAQPCSSVELQDIYDKLYNYEQAQAEGLIIKLPVPVGTKVYAFRKACAGRAANGLLRGNSLFKPCPYYDTAARVCKKHRDTTFQSSADLPDVCERGLEIYDLNCLYRLYTVTTTFQVVMADAVVTTLQFPVPIEKLYLSEDDMRQALFLIEKDMKNIGKVIENAEQSIHKPKYF